MFDMQVYDEVGQKIEYFTQWDSKRIITLNIDGVDVLNLQNPPYIQFFNINSEEALSIRALNSDNPYGQYMVEVPNCLLIEEYPIAIYVYASESVDKGRSIANSCIIMRKRPVPEDFSYVDNIEIYNVMLLADEMKELLKEVKDKIDTYTVIVDDANKVIKDASDAALKAEKANKTAYELIDYINSKKETIDNLPNIANNLTTTVSGYILDARQGNVLYEMLNEDVTQEDIAYIFR